MSYLPDKMSLPEKGCASKTQGQNIPALPDVDLFKGCTPDFLSKLEAQGNIRDIAKGHVVFMQDDLAEWFYLVQSGWIKLYRQTLDGEEVIIDVLPAGTLFGEKDLFDKRLYTASAEAVQDSRIAAYPTSLLRAEIASNQSFALMMLKHMAEGHREKDKEIEHRTIQNAPQRLGCFLLRLIPENRKGPVTLHLPYDKMLIASRLGMQSETFSRALARLRDDLDLKIKGSTIEIPSMDALISYTCTACSNVYPCE